MSKEIVMSLEEAEKIAADIVRELSPLADRIEIVGSIRRRRPAVHDIDIILIPKEGKAESLKDQCLAWQPLFSTCPAPKWGDKLASFWYDDKIQVDLYFANDYTWPILKLIRTGSKEHNVKLCMVSANKGMKLKADGSGLFRDRLETERVDGIKDEADIFAALGLRYVEPEDREA